MSEAPTPAEPPARSRRWLQRLGLATLALALALGLAWLHPLTQHRFLLALSSLERRWSTGGEAPSPSGAWAGAHWAHAAWATSEAPPNSAPSARAACATFRGVEVDVAFSLDLVPYVSHDNDFERYSGKAGDRLSLHSAAEIDALRGPTGEAPLRLAALVPEARCEVLVLDVKTDHRRSEAKARAVTRALGSRRRGVWALSMSGPFLQALGSKAPELRLGCEGYLSLGNSLAGFHVLSLDRAQVTSARDAAARRRGLLRLYWTARDEAELKELRAWEPDALLFDAPRIPASKLPPGTRREGGS